MTRYLVVFLAGILATFSFAPFGLWWLMPVTLAALMSVWLDSSPKKAFLTGWLFGAGYFAVGLYWIHHSMSVFGGMPLPLALMIALLLALLLATYFGLAGYAARRLCRVHNHAAQLISFVLTLTATEWIRSWLLTGFPWLSTGYSQIDSPLANFAPISGVHLVSLMLAITSALLIMFINGDTRARAYIGVVIFLLWLSGFSLQQIHWTDEDGDLLIVSLIQGNIPQDKKWQPEMFIPTLEYYSETTIAHLDSDLVLWPESAIPSVKSKVDEDLLKPLKSILGESNTTLIAGVLSNPEDGVYYNSLLAMNTEEHLYHKRHLVPFGEYFPLGFLWKDALRGLATIGDDFTSHTADRSLLPVGKWQAGASICYEIIFGEEIRDALPDAHFLINMSNDAWFGRTNGPKQHLEMARMRALENGRFLLRSTNTGITAVINTQGEIQDQLAQFERGVLTTTMQPMRGATPFSKFGMLVFWIMWMVLLLLCFILNRKENKVLLPSQSLDNK